MIIDVEYAGEGIGKTRKTSPKEISLGEDFGDVAVRVNGVRVEVTHDGIVTTGPPKRPRSYAGGTEQEPL